MKKLVFFVLLALALSPAAFAAAPPTTSVSVTVGPEGSLTIPATTTLTSPGGFQAYAGPTPFNFMIRTGTGGTVTLMVTSDFACGASGSPCVAVPPSVGDTLSYTCTAAGTSTPTGQVASLSSSTTVNTNVLSVGANKYSAASPGDTGTVNWSLTNDPKYKIGTYSATVTFTISAS